MRMKILKDVVYFEGFLDERSDPAEWKTGLTKMKDQKIIAMDHSRVSRANSAGIVIWLKFVEKLKTPIKYVNCPVWLVGQLNMIKGFLKNDSFVESLQLPYHCEKNDESKTFLAVIGKEIPLQKEYSKFKAKNRVEDGHEYQPDFQPKNYLAFIGHSFENFKKNIK